MSSVISFPSSRPQPRKPTGLISLYDMLRVYADAFVIAASQIGQIHEQVRQGGQPASESWGTIADTLNNLRRQCEPLELSSTVAQLRRVQNIVNRGNVYLPEFTAALLEITSRMSDELSARYLYCLESKQAAYIASHHFSSAVTERFPEAIPDMEEAAKCYAFERPTACVFHLMRVTEYAVKAVAELLEITDHNPTWKPIIRKIDAELKAEYKNRRYKGDQEFLSAVSSHLHAVKTAWRNRTMHVEKIHTMENAKEIYDATCGLMRYLGESMPGKKVGLVQSISQQFRRTGRSL